MKLSQYSKTLVRVRPLNSCLDLKSFPLVGVLLFFLVLISGLTAITIRAQVPAGRNRPATVPAGYLVTPFGYFHPTCVKHLSRGDVLLKDQHAVQHVDGSFDSIPVCDYPRYNAKGEDVSNTHSLATDSQGRLPTISGDNWIEDESISTGTSFGELVANWSVPPAPTSNDGQTLFFFPAMNDTNTEYDTNNGSIIQPVLGWNGDYTNAWSIASWNCCITGITSESSPVSVNAGDTILGTIQSTCSAGTLSCSSWNITTKDVTSGGTTTLLQSSSNGQTFNQAYAGTLEVYNITQCSDYPPNGALEFSNVALYDNDFNLISSPSWIFDNYYSSLTPQCAYGGQATAQQVALEYGVPAPVMTSHLFCLPPHGCSSSITMTDNNPSASIYYTTNGTTPTTSSTLYTGGFEPVGGDTYESIAVVGSVQSTVTTTVTNGNQ